MQNLQTFISLIRFHLSSSFLFGFSACLFLIEFLGLEMRAVGIITNFTTKAIGFQTVFYLAFITVILYFLSDIAASLADPRIRLK